MEQECLVPGMRVRITMRLTVTYLRTNTGVVESVTRDGDIAHIRLTEPALVLGQYGPHHFTRVVVLHRDDFHVIGDCDGTVGETGDEAVFC